MTKDCYQIILDKPALESFIEWLPELDGENKYYLSLFSRSKYFKDAPQVQILRYLSNKERFLEKIEQLECPVGSYKFKGAPIPQEGLALYMTPNPRGMKKAAFKTIGKLADLLEKGEHTNPHQECLSEIHRTCGQKHFIDFDIDSKDKTILSAAIKLVDGRCELLETRGGYHLMVKSKDAKEGFSEKLWYKKIVELADVSADPNSMIPVPGSFHGGFCPRFVDTNKFI